VRVCIQFAGPSLSARRYSHDIKNIHDCVSCHSVTLCLFPGEITAQKFVCLRTVDKIAVACGKGGSAKQTGRKKKSPTDRLFHSVSLRKEAGRGLELFTCRVEDCTGHLKEKKTLLVSSYCD